MSLISKPYTFSNGTVIVAAEHNSNFDTLYSDYNGNIINANISGSAAITYAKLNLANGIVNSDINSAAAIADSKLAQITTAGKVAGGAITSGTVGAAYIDSGTTANKIVALDANAKLPAVDGSQLLNVGAPYQNGSTYTDVTGATERNQTGSQSYPNGYVKVKELSPLLRSGHVTVQWDSKATPGNYAHTKLYVNGLAVSADHSNATSTYATETESNIAVAVGDVVQIYCTWGGGSSAVYVKNLKICCTNPTTPQEASGY